MTFAARDLSVLAYANGFTLWHYTTPDTNPYRPNYFDPAYDMLRAGDMIITNYENTDIIKTVILIVHSKRDGMVFTTTLA